MSTPCTRYEVGEVCDQRLASSVLVVVESVSEGLGEAGSERPLLPIILS